jgi:hypothetical protein
MAMGTGRKWVGTIVILVVLLLISAVPGHTDRGGHGYRGHGYRGHGFRGHGFHHGFHRGFKGPRVHIGIGLGTFWGLIGPVIPTRQWWSLRLLWWSSPQRQLLPCLRPHPNTGIIVILRRATTPMCNSAQGDGGR